jgi:1-deoxy-D-xylulose-5-phosphate synthase
MIPEMVIMSPKDESELRDMLYTAVTYTGGPIALRYPRGNGVGVPLKSTFNAVPIGKGESLRVGRDVALLAVGALVQEALKAADELEKEGISCEVVNMRFVKPIDEGLLNLVASRIGAIVTLEDNVVTGGFGSAVLEHLAANGMANVRVKVHGVPGRFIEHGAPAELYRDLGMDAPGIVAVVREFLQRSTPRARETVSTLSQ